VTYNFQDIIESFERAIGSDKQIYIKTLPLPANSDNGIFKFNLALVNANLSLELQRQSIIKSVINRPSTTKKVKPSKPSTTKMSKRSLASVVPT
jgi:hypothetical protein